MGKGAKKDRRATVLLSDGGCGSVPLAVPLARPDREPTDQVPTDRVPTDRVPTDRVPTDRVPTDRVPTDRVTAVRSARPAPGADLPPALAAIAGATALTGAKKVKKKCCRSTPRCKGCPVLLMRATRLQESGLTGKEFKKALKKARAA